jgi:DNA invertase Pin-like site-specific DNA recombinase
MATSMLEISQPQRPQTRFVVDIEEPFALSLKEWFEKACESDNIDRFAAQILECALAEYRLQQLPPGQEDDHDSRRQKLTPFQEVEIFETYADGDSSVSELAIRFAVNSSSIRRIIRKKQAETGRVIDRKPSLTEAQIAEIRRLYAAGVDITELAKRFDRGRAYVDLVARRKVRL